MRQFAPQPTPGGPNASTGWQWRRLRKVGNPEGTLSKMAGENGGVGVIDGRVKDVILLREHGLRSVGQRADAKAAHLRPAHPAVVEPPVVMVRDKRNTARGTSAGELSGE